MNAPLSELARAAELTRLTAERDAALAEVQRLDAEVERCHERLEMTFHWRVTDIATGAVERVDIPRAERSFADDGITCRDETIKGQDRVIDELRAEVQRLREALTPSAETKAAYSGEFQFPFPCFDEDDNEQTMTPNVPWTTIKAIMAAIRARSLVEPAP